MAFLRLRDYFTEIRETDIDAILKQISQTTAHTQTKIRQDNELDIQENVATMIRHRYDERRIYQEIIPFVKADTYQIGDLIEYTEPAYDRSLTYVLNNRVSFEQQINGLLNDDIFNANTSVAANESPKTNPEKWDKITENNSLFFAEQPSTSSNPDTPFAYSLNNFTGNHDTILGWDKTNTIFFEREDTLVRLYYSAADRTNKSNSIGVVDYDPVAKVFPDNRPIFEGEDRENSLSNRRRHHGAHGHHINHGHHDQHDSHLRSSFRDLNAYNTQGNLSRGGDLSFIGFVPDGTLWDVIPSNAFIKGDNRNRTIRQIVIALAIFQLHKLINPRNIPELRIDARDEAMSLLNKISTGKITADLPIFHDEQRGQSTTFNSNPRFQYDY